MAINPESNPDIVDPATTQSSELAYRRPYPQDFLDNLVIDQLFRSMVNQKHQFGSPQRKFAFKTEPAFDTRPLCMWVKDISDAYRQDIYQDLIQNLLTPGTIVRLEIVYNTYGQIIALRHFAGSPIDQYGGTLFGVTTVSYGKNEQNQAEMQGTFVSTGNDHIISGQTSTQNAGLRPTDALWGGTVEIDTEDPAQIATTIRKLAVFPIDQILGTGKLDSFTLPPGHHRKPMGELSKY